MPLLNVFGQLENFIADDLYPYRYVITPLLILAVAAVVYVAYRMGLHQTMLRHKMATTLIGVPMIVIVVAAGDYFVSPLWERSHLEEASPLVAADVASPDNTSSAVEPTAAPSEPATGGSSASFEAMVVQSGEFSGSDDFHFGRGDAQLIETAPGTYVLRFENFSVRNGPDLYVYLSEDPSGKSVDEALNLGPLKATDGAFNYELPDGVDISNVKSAVVWCRQFSVLFAHAELL
jgi:Electron transfer DM13